MNTYISLLKSVNAGGHNIIKMAELKTAIENEGFENVKTYIQSGNIIFNSNLGDKELINSKILEIINKNFSLNINGLLLTKEEFLKYVTNNPFPEKIAKDVMVIFLDKPVSTREQFEKISQAHSSQEEINIQKNKVYIHSIAGFSHSKLNIAFFEKLLNTKATARNMNTVLKINAILESY